MNIPNILTVARIILTFVFLSFLSKEGLILKIAATVIFGIASLTDFLDGYYARKYNLITTFGKIMDPIADKFLVLSAFFVFTRMQFIPVWMFMVIALRELLITGLRFIAMRHGIVLAAEKSGKIKTVLQILAIILFLIFMILTELVVDKHWPQIYALRVYMWTYGLMFGVTAVTLGSGIGFLWNNRKGIFKNDG